MLWKITDKFTLCRHKCGRCCHKCGGLCCCCGHPKNRNVVAEIAIIFKNLLAFNYKMMWYMNLICRPSWFFLPSPLLPWLLQWGFNFCYALKRRVLSPCSSGFRFTLVQWNGGFFHIYHVRQGINSATCIFWQVEENDRLKSELLSKVKELEKYVSFVFRAGICFIYWMFILFVVIQAFFLFSFDCLVVYYLLSVSLLFSILIPFLLGLELLTGTILAELRTLFGFQMSKL